MATNWKKKAEEFEKNRDDWVEAYNKLKNQSWQDSDHFYKGFFFWPALVAVCIILYMAYYGVWWVIHDASYHESHPIICDSQTGKCQFISQDK